jgi:penicillin-binding protein 1A
MVTNKAIAYNGEMWPHNEDGSYGDGNDVTVQYGLKMSLNTISARVCFNTLKVNNSFEFLRDNYGFTKIDPRSNGNDALLPAMAVGAMYNGFSTLEEAAAYAVFGNGGVYYSPYCYKLVCDYDDKILLEHEAQGTGKRVFSKETAKVMNELLQTIPNPNTAYQGRNGTIKKYKLYGKTGTTQDNKDRWFAGGTPHYVASVWLGYDTPKSLGKMSNPSRQIWFEVFNRIHKIKALDPKKDFPTTNKAVKKSYCTSTGLLAGKYCPATATGWYKVSNLPKTCAVHGAALVAPSVDSDISTTVPHTTSPAISNFWNSVADALDDVLGLE